MKTSFSKFPIFPSRRMDGDVLPSTTHRVPRPRRCVSRAKLTAAGWHRIGRLLWCPRLTPAPAPAAMAVLDGADWRLAGWSGTATTSPAGASGDAVGREASEKAPWMGLGGFTTSDRPSIRCGLGVMSRMLWAPRLGSIHFCSHVVCGHGKHEKAELRIHLEVHLPEVLGWAVAGGRPPGWAKKKSK